MQDLLLHDTRLSLAVRMVGLELLGFVNRTCGYAWPSNNLIATRLGLTVRTVSHCTAMLEQFGYFVVRRNVRGRSNTYEPCLGSRVEIASSQSKTPRVEKSTAEGGKVRPARVEEKRTLSHLDKSIRSPSTTWIRKEPRAGGVGPSFGAKQDELELKPDDGKVERSVSKQLDELGVDGDEVLGVLHSVDRGRPYRRLITSARDRRLSAQELDAAVAFFKSSVVSSCGANTSAVLLNPSGINRSS